MWVFYIRTTSIYGYIFKWFFHYPASPAESRILLVILLLTNSTFSNNDTYNPNRIEILYFSRVRSMLEHGSVVWNPHRAILITKIERI